MGLCISSMWEGTHTKELLYPKNRNLAAALVGKLGVSYNRASLRLHCLVPSASYTSSINAGLLLLAQVSSSCSLVLTGLGVELGRLVCCGSALGQQLG